MKPQSIKSSQAAALSPQRQALKDVLAEIAAHDQRISGLSSMREDLAGRKWRLEDKIECEKQALDEMRDASGDTVLQTGGDIALVSRPMAVKRAEIEAMQDDLEIIKAAIASTDQRLREADSRPNLLVKERHADALSAILEAELLENVAAQMRAAQDELRHSSRLMAHILPCLRGEARQKAFRALADNGATIPYVNGPVSNYSIHNWYEGMVSLDPELQRISEEVEALKKSGESSELVWG